MSSKDSSHYFRFFFSFPSLTAIVAATLIFETAISTALLVSCPVLEAFPHALLLVFTPTLYSLLVHRVFFHGDRVFTLRRFLALQLVQEAVHISLLPLLFLRFLLPLDSCRIFLITIAFGTAVSSLLVILVFLGFCRMSIAATLAAVFLQVLLQSSRWLFLSIVILKTWIVLFSGVILPVSAGLLFLSALRIKQSRGDAPRPLRIFQAYLDYYFNGDEAPLEEMFEVMSENSVLRISSISFNSMNTLFSLIGVGVHFGPFKTVGSSPLPSYLVEELEERTGRKIMLLRFLSNHSLNLPSKKEVRKMGSLIIETFKSATRLEDYSASFSQKEFEGYCVTALRIGPYCIILLSCPGYSSEDLPPEWLPGFYKIVNQNGLTPLLVSDAHNSIDSSSWILFQPDESKLTRLLEEAMMELKQAPPENLKIGFNRFTHPSLHGDEIGSGGVSTLLFNIGGRNHALIVIDGNNMIKGVRGYLVKNLKDSLGLSAVEVATTDTHLLTGLKQARKGYFPIGFKTGKECLLEACRESVMGAMRSLSQCSAEAYVGEFYGVKVTGRLFEDLEALIGYSEKIIAILILMLVFSTGLLLLL